MIDNVIAIIEDIEKIGEVMLIFVIEVVVVTCASLALIKFITWCRECATQPRKLKGECGMRTVTKTIYDYKDMKALDDMTHEEAADYLRSAYRGYINRYVFPREYDEFSEADYHDYAIQCAFRIAYRVLEGDDEE